MPLDDPSPLGSPDDSALPVSALFTGPARYRALTPWGTFTALAVTALAVLLAPGAWSIVLALYQQSAGMPVSGLQTLTLASPELAGMLIAGQLTTILVLWLFAGRAGMRPDVLQYRQRPLGFTGSIVAGLIILVATGLLELGLHASGNFDPFGESRILVEGLRSPYWWATVLAAVVLAPISEELAFRGFLLTALAKRLMTTRVGFAAAGLITTTLWTSMHIQYSLSGMASVFVAGLVLTWVMWRTASMRACILAHALINATSLTFLAVFAP